VDCSRAIYEQDLKKVAIPLKIVAVFEPSEKSCQFSEEKRHFSEKKKWFVLCPSRPVRPDNRPGGINQCGIMHLTSAAVLCCGFCTAHPVQLSTGGQGWS
jgi:hypothetical protein